MKPLKNFASKKTPSTTVNNKKTGGFKPKTNIKPPQNIQIHCHRQYSVEKLDFKPKTYTKQLKKHCQLFQGNPEFQTITQRKTTQILR